MEWVYVNHNTGISKPYLKNDSDGDKDGTVGYWSLSSIHIQLILTLCTDFKYSTNCNMVYNR